MGMRFVPSVSLMLLPKMMATLSGVRIASTAASPSCRSGSGVVLGERQPDLPVGLHGRGWPAPGPVDDPLKVARKGPQLAQQLRRASSDLARLVLEDPGGSLQLQNE